MQDLERKQALILDSERAFANAIGAAVFEKPRVSFWMILLPFLFLYFVYRMQRFKNGRLKFDAEFMAARRKAMGLAAESVASGKPPAAAAAAAQSGLPDSLEKPYAAFLAALADYYADLLRAEGASFNALARRAYRSRANFLFTLNRLGAAEKEFHAALNPHMAGTEGAAEIMAAIETHSQRLRRELAERAFG
jgi:hypothetical protein